MFRLVKPYLRIGARSWGASSQYAFSMEVIFFKEAQLASSQYAFSMEVIFFKEAQLASSQYAFSMEVIFQRGAIGFKSIRFFYE